MNDAAMVTLAIGEPYLTNWQKYCAPGWRAYAEKHQFDLIVVTEPLDRSPIGESRSPAWQKCLALSQDFARPYRQVVLLDSDIVINHPMAPKITSQVPADHIGGVISGSHIQEDLRALLLSRAFGEKCEYRPGARNWQLHQSSLYALQGLSPLDAGIVQTGVLVASPQHHRELFEQVYHANHPVVARSYEQLPLSHAILSSGLFHPIDTRFNNVFYDTILVHYPHLMNKDIPGYQLLANYAIGTQLANSFFLHFAGCPDFMHFLAE